MEGHWRDIGFGARLAASVVDQKINHKINYLNTLLSTPTARFDHPPTVLDYPAPFRGTTDLVWNRKNQNLHAQKSYEKK